MLAPSQSRSIDPSAQRVCSARAVGIGSVASMVVSGEARIVRAADPLRLKSGGAVMTAERVSHGVEQRFARCAWFEALAPVNQAESTGADCPETRMAGDNHHHHHHHHHHHKLC